MNMIADHSRGKRLATKAGRVTRRLMRIFLLLFCFVAVARGAGPESDAERLRIRITSQNTARTLFPEVDDPQSRIGAEVERLAAEYEAAQDEILFRDDAPLIITQRAAERVLGAITVTESEKDALRLFPDLALADSPLKKLFEQRREERRKASNPADFSNPRWPVLLAFECAVVLDPTRLPGTEASPANATAKPAPPTPSPAPGNGPTEVADPGAAAGHPPADPSSRKRPLIGAEHAAPDSQPLPLTPVVSPGAPPPLPAPPPAGFPTRAVDAPPPAAPGSNPPQPAPLTELDPIIALDQAPAKPARRKAEKPYWSKVLTQVGPYLTVALALASLAVFAAAWLKRQRD